MTAFVSRMTALMRAAVDIDGGQAGEATVGVHDDREMVVAQHMQDRPPGCASWLAAGTPRNPLEARQAARRKPGMKSRLVTARECIEILRLPARRLRARGAGTVSRPHRRWRASAARVSLRPPSRGSRSR